MSDCSCDLPPTWPGHPCDICTSKESVESLMVEIRQGDCIRSDRTHVQSDLCSLCKKEGWTIFGKASPDGKIIYYNLKTQRFRSV